MSDVPDQMVPYSRLRTAVVVTAIIVAALMVQIFAIDGAVHEQPGNPNAVGEAVSWALAGTVPYALGAGLVGWVISLFFRPRRP